jgi:hypothetical protein
MASHYLFEAEFCNPASGWEKGQVEKNVQDSRHRLWQPIPRFPSLEALNDWLEQRCRELWQQIPHGLRPGTIEDIRAEEARLLMPVPRSLTASLNTPSAVSPTCLVHLERNRYSVPASFANRPVSLRVYPERIVVAAEGQLICEHRRIIERSHDRLGQTVYDWRHCCGCTAGVEPGQGAEGRCRALRYTAPGQGGAPCVMIPRAPPSSSCSGA